MRRNRVAHPRLLDVQVVEEVMAALAESAHATSETEAAESLQSLS